MSKFKTRILPHVNGKTYVFVTRGKSKHFSDEEMVDFLDGLEEEDDSDFNVPSTKIFSQDLRAGLAFCSKKYGASVDAVKRKAAKMFPHLSIDQLTK